LIEAGLDQPSRFPPISLQCFPEARRLSLANFAKFLLFKDKPRRALLGTNPMSHIDRKRSERLQVMLASDLLAAIDEFRYRARMPTLSAAVRELLRRGLASTEKEEK
jgi:hypothetical protein